MAQHAVNYCFDYASPCKIRGAPETSAFPIHTPPKCVDSINSSIHELETLQMAPC